MSSVIKKYIHQQKGFESISRNMLQDHDNLSLQAIGLLAHLQSLPDTWTINKTELYKRFAKNGRTSVSNAWNELIEQNYVLQFKKRFGKKYVYTYYFSHEKFSTEDIQQIEKIEQTSIWDGKKGSSSQNHTSTNQNTQKPDDTNDISNVDFEHPKMGIPKPTPIKLDLKEIDLKDSTDTEDTKETETDLVSNRLSESERAKKQDQMLKDSLRDTRGMSHRLFEILNTFSKDFDQMYKWIGIIFRAKDKAEKNTGELLLIEKEENNDLLCTGVMTIIRNIRTQEKENPDGYMFTSLVNFLEESISQQTRIEVMERKNLEHHYLHSDQ